MERRMRSGRRGFTLVELMVVMAIVLVVVSVAVPLYNKSVIRARESVLRQNLFTMRAVIDEYTYDKQKAPQTLEDLAREGYLRQIPVDPIVGNNSSWRLIMEEAAVSASQSEPGIFDIRSSSEKISLEGTKYSEW
ncbi:MAG: prepilin-type N-terminal cleavage/methylation domain-containing protein [Acidobacteriaceae bacterium]|jgi:general secretion pathway protein G|nr:prepilin-type N-terminal cleavage/methylation domain-containing protein [Acidobacteriaceae bacterium]